MKKNILAISLIILFSIILWGSVSLSKDYIATISVPIQLIDLPDNYTTGYISDKSVYLRIKSKGWELAKMFLGRDNEFNVSAHRKIGRRRIDLHNEIQNNSWLTSTVQVLEMVPLQVECDVDKIVSKNVTVAGNYKIEYKEGYGLASAIQINPAKILIYGPYSILQNIDTLKTEYVEFKNVTDPVNEEIKLEEIEGIEYQPVTCNLFIDVQKIVERSFDNILVEIRNVPPSKELILYPSKIDVVLKGGINILGRLSTDSVKVYVDYWSVVKNEGEPIEPVIEFPVLTEVVDVKPKKLEYIIKQY